MREQFGEIWLEYEIGDCLQLLQKIPSESVGLVLTDPPYGQDIGYGRSEFGHRFVQNDDNLNWLEPFAREMWRVLKPDSWCIVFGQWRTYTDFLWAFTGVGFGLKTVAIWDKETHGLGAGLAEGYEQFYAFRKGMAKENAFRSNMFRYPCVNGRPLHPNQKPIALFEEIINLCSQPKDVVLDPFVGSGTTLAACRRTGRSGIGFEICPEYETAIKDSMLASVKGLYLWEKSQNTEACQ